MLKLLKFSFVNDRFISIDDAAYELADILSHINITVVPFIEDELICVIIDTTQEEQIINKIKDYYSLESQSSVKEENWIQKCTEILSDIKINNLKISSCLNTDITSSDKNEILIKAGTGFGTGHHPTTLMLLELIESNADIFSHANNLCDLGTGSGILAITINKLYNKEIIAIDNDEMALENARENVEINQCKKIEIKNSDKLPNSKQDLIIANLYSELLISLKNDFFATLNKNGYLFVSGILNEQVESIKSEFIESNFKVYLSKSKKDSNNNTWHAIIFTKF
jgi:ribosomal protein L11 methyltransferase